MLVDAVEISYVTKAEKRRPREAAIGGETSDSFLAPLIEEQESRTGGKQGGHINSGQKV